MHSYVANFLQICVHYQKYWNNAMSNDGLIIEMDIDLSHIHWTYIFFLRIRNQKICSIWVFTNWSLHVGALTIEPIYIKCAWVQKYTVERFSKATGKFWSVWNMIAIAIIHVGFFCLFNVNTYPEIATFFSSMCYLLVKKFVVLPVPWSLLALPL